MRKFLSSFCFIFVLTLLIGCSSIDSLKESDLSDADSYYKIPSNSEEPSEQHQVEKGQLTASHWNDMANYGFWKGLFQSSQESSKGLFGTYHEMGFFDTLNMIKVTALKGSEKIQFARVSLIAGETEVYTSVTNANGIAYLFPKTDALEEFSKIDVTINDVTTSFPFSYVLEEDATNIEVELQLEQELAPSTNLELMFVVDTTGSMSDEMEYLKVEIDDVIRRIKEMHSDLTISLALLFYRDKGDDYVTKYFDFSTDIIGQKQNLAKQSADGGGDYPEAVDRALDEAVNKQWSSGNTTKLLIHVLDAPPHTNNENKMDTYVNAVDIASKKGIRIIPVASSGVDEMTEYLLRSSAMLTGGDYIFLTNHSGIGGDHIEASTGEVVVEYLNNLIVRIIRYHITGVLEDPIPYFEDQ